MGDILQFPDPDRSKRIRPGMASSEEIDAFARRVSPSPKFEDVYRNFLGAVLGPVEYVDEDEDEEY